MELAQRRIERCYLNELTMSDKLIMLGGGGHCSSILDSVLQMKCYDRIVIVDPNMIKNSYFMGCEVVGTDDDLLPLYNDGYKCAFVSIGSIDSSSRRWSVFIRAKEIGFRFPNIVDHNSVVAESCCLGRGIYIGKNAVINSMAKIGDFSIINTGAIIEHGCIVGEFSHVSVGAVVCGDVIIGNNCLIGANSTIIQGVRIGDGCIIGAGSTVLSDVPANNRVYDLWK